MAIEWTGEGVDEVGTDGAGGRVVMRIDSRYFRPTEVDALLGDPTKAREKLGWSPMVSFEALVDALKSERRSEIRALSDQADEEV
jgi:GDPmannose 4,6-dehydratase